MRGSSLWELESGMGEPGPPLVDKDDTLEYRLPQLLVPPCTELVLDGDVDLSLP